MEVKETTVEEVVSPPAELPGNGQLPADNRPASIKLEQAIREVVREEVARPRPLIVPEAKPTFSDAAWWLLCLIDIALLLWWIPENFFESRRVDFFIKAAAFIGSSLFLLTYAWFKEQILSFTRRRIFHVLVIAFLIVLLPFYISLFPIFRLNPRVEPQTAELIVDGKTETKFRPDDLRLSVGQHTITVIDTTSDEKPNSRDFQVGYLDFLRSWFRKDAGPYWPLLYPVGISTDEPGVVIVIRKKDGDFDRDFTRGRHTTGFKAPIQFIEPKVLSFAANENGIDSISLPYGTYEFIARKEGCGQTEPQIISAHNADAAFTIEGLCR